VTKIEVNKSEKSVFVSLSLLRLLPEGSCLLVICLRNGRKVLTAIQSKTEARVSPSRASFKSYSSLMQSPGVDSQH
jgi:hypothetical protein